MTDILSALLALGFGAAALGSWVAIVVFGFKALRRPRPGIALWGRATFWNPANALLRPELLTPEGQRYQHRCLRAVLVFVVSISFARFALRTRD